MQALPLASLGNKASTSGVNSASMHQQRLGLVPAARAISMAHAFSDWQTGQQVGSMLSICYSVTAKTGVFNPRLGSFCRACCARCAFCLSRSFLKAAVARLLVARS